MQKPKRGETDEEVNINEFERFIGADPGVSNVLTAMTDTGEKIKISTKEYRHMAHMHKQQQWNERLKKRNSSQAYTNAIQNMP
eukprot:570547-Hanusia_phi.AAC.1